jgi:deoxyribonuclease-4
MILGVHVSTAGGINEALGRASELGCNTMQIFSRNPQQWRESSLSQEDIDSFRRKRAKLKISPFFVHIPYLINLASPNPNLYKASIEAYIEDIQEAQKLKVDYIVTHMGSHKNTTEEEGLERLIKALNKILQKTATAEVKLLLENTAGSGSWLGYTFSHQARVLREVEDKKRIGLCLDTAHAYLAGYDLSTKEGLERMLDEIDTLVGADTIKLIHLNDAKDKLDSHRDRHEHIGKGNIGLEGMRRIINHPLLRDLAFILETPKDSDDADEKNLKVVKSLRK